MNEQRKCEDQVVEHLRSRITDLRALWRAYQSGEEDVPNLGNFCEYGLSFDYVPPGTFNGQRRGYFRYQISWGGPSDEFRFYVDESFKPLRIEYWFMDWFDGAKRILRRRDLDLLREVWEWFEETGTVKVEYDKAREYH